MAVLIAGGIRARRARRAVAIDWIAVHPGARAARVLAAHAILVTVRCCCCRRRRRRRRAVVASGARPSASICFADEGADQLPLLGKAAFGLSERGPQCKLALRVGRRRRLLRPTGTVFTAARRSTSGTTAFSASAPGFGAAASVPQLPERSSFQRPRMILRMVAPSRWYARPVCRLKIG